jgi:pyrimidine deaminase RibD-like protein
MELPDFREVLRRCCEIAADHIEPDVYKPFVGSLLWQDGEAVSIGHKKVRRFNHYHTKKRNGRPTSQEDLIPELRNRVLCISPDGDLYADVLFHAEQTVLEGLVKGLDYEPDRAILFSTLEPCVPGSRAYGRNGVKSCSELIVDSGIKTVVVGDLDETKSVKRGSGVRYLKSQGLDVHFDQDYARVIANTCNYSDRLKRFSSES